MTETEKKWLTYKEMADMYGIKRDTARKLVVERKLKRRKIGNAWMYSVESIEKKVFA